MSYSGPSVFYIHAGDGSTTGYYAVTKRPQNSAVTAGSLARQFTAPSFQSERVFACVVAGTTANTTDASWSTSKGTKTTDGTATWIEVTGQPGVNGDFGSNCPVWVASATPPLGLVIYHSGTSSLQVCTTSGAGSGSTPSFSAAAGVTVSDGSAVWTSLGPTGGFGTWGAPHATLEAAVSYGAVGNDFYIADNSTYVPGSSRTINAPSASYNGGISRILSIDHTKSLPPSSGSLKAGAVIGTSSGSIPSMNLINSVQNSYWYGITISITNWGGLNIGGGGSGTPIAVFDTCQFNLANSHVSANFNGPGFFTLNNCTFNLVSSGQVINLGNARVIWKNTSSPFPGAAPSSFLVCNGNGAYWGTCVVENVDLSACTGAVIQGQPNYPGGMFTLKDCKLPSSGPITSGMYPGVIADVIRCDRGGTNYRNERHDEWGDMWTAANAHRSGGASDGATAVAWKMYGRNSAWVLPFEGWRMAIWNSVTGTNRVVTVYACVFAAALQQ